VSEDAAMEAKMAAAEAAANGDFAAAAASYTTALAANPSALTYAKRAEALIQMGHPTAALADCDKAIELNPDSAKAPRDSTLVLLLLSFSFDVPFPFPLPFTSSVSAHLCSSLLLTGVQSGGQGARAHG